MEIPAHKLKRFTPTVLGIEAINTAVRAFASAFAPAGPVLEVGSYYPEAYKNFCDRRQFFPGLEYIGCDLRSGCGVDRIEDAQNLSFSDRSFGTVILLEILEHLPHPERAIAEAQRVLRDDGRLLLSVPFSYRLHGFPHDYRRLTSSGIYEVLAAFPQKLVFAIGPRVKPATVFAVARMTEREDFSVERERFRSAMQAQSKALLRRLFWSALHERARDLMGLLLGRADITVAFYDPAEGGGYVYEVPQAGKVHSEGP
ncbi:MAG TPA: methyltransferase domain-containing protein [Bryobacteraceae bacterium]|jgi:SAM-dependent methyltransferase|nr:methyltransferase domain-containing protein [Bryobacteraceae bacterium]